MGELYYVRKCWWFNGKNIYIFLFLKEIVFKLFSVFKLKVFHFILRNSTLAGFIYKT